MRILVVTNLYPPVAIGGYETCCAMVVDRLRQHHDVHLLTSDVRADSAPAEPWIRRWLPLFSSVSGDTLTAPLVTRRAMAATRRTLDELRPDLIFVWAGAAIPKGAMWVLERAGRPLAFDIHDHWFDQPYEHDPYTRYLFGRERGLRRAWSAAVRLVNRAPSLGVQLHSSTRAAVCWNSEATRSRSTIPATIDPVLARTVYPGTVHEAELSRLARAPSPRPTIAFVGRVTREKGPDLAIRALHGAVRDHGIDADLEICGPVAPSMRRELEALARRLDVAARVRVLGRQTPAELGAAFARAHVLVVPSVWQEPFGLVCLEGALARVPVVAAASGGILEILRPDEHAVFFPVGDARAAAAAMARVLTRPDETSARVARAYARAGEFPTAKFIEQSERFVEDAYAVLTGHPIAAAER